MKEQENFIPNKIEILDSDDSSIFEGETDFYLEGNYHSSDSDSNVSLMSENVNDDNDRIENSEEIEAEANFSTDDEIDDVEEQTSPKSNSNKPLLDADEQTKQANMSKNEPNFVEGKIQSSVAESNLKQTNCDNNAENIIPNTNNDDTHLNSESNQSQNLKNISNSQSLSSKSISTNNSSDGNDCKSPKINPNLIISEKDNFEEGPSTSNKNENVSLKEMDSDSSSEEEACTMEEMFAIKPNKEANRNHPPNFNAKSPVLDICFHPQEEVLALATIDGDCSLYKYTKESVDEIKSFSHHKKSCRQVCYNNEGNLIYTVSKDKSIAVIDVEKSTLQMHIKKAHEAAIYSFLEIDAYTCCTGDDDGTVKIWDLRKSSSVMDFKCGDQTVTSLLTCSRNRFLSATVADGSLAGFNLRTKKLEAQSEMYDREFFCQSLVRNESRLAVGTGTGIMYIFKWGEFGYNIDAFDGHRGAIQCQAAIDDKLILTGSEDGNIRAVQLYEHRFMGVVGQHDLGVENLAVSNDGNLLASCSIDEYVQFWDIEYLYKWKENRKKVSKGKKRYNRNKNLQSSKKRNAAEFFRDIPAQIEISDDERGAVKPMQGHTFYDDDSD